MRSFMVLRKSVLATASGACLLGSVHAQTTLDSTTGKPEVNQSGIKDAGAPGSQPAQREAARANVRQPGDAQPSQAVAGDLSQQIASCLVLGNQEEVALAEIAQKQAEHPAVKKFVGVQMLANCAQLYQVHCATCVLNVGTPAGRSVTGS